VSPTMLPMERRSGERHIGSCVTLGMTGGGNVRPSGGENRSQRL
jgi:hypothetical protein